MHLSEFQMLQIAAEYFSIKLSCTILNKYIRRA